MFLQLLIGGIAMGLIYALIAIEYTLIYNSCALLNFAHGQLVMFGAYIFAGTMVTSLGMSFAAGWIGTIILSGIIGVALALSVFIPLKDVGKLYAIIATLMFSMMITDSVTLLWGQYPFYLNGYLSGIIRIGMIAFPVVYFYIIAICAVVVVLLLYFMNKTKTGRAMKCVSENKGMAAMVGINVKKNMVITIVLSVIICAVVGMLLAPLLSVTITMGSTVSSKGFTAGVLGGFGSVPGAIIGGLIVGVIENCATMYIPSVYKDVISYVILFLVILIKPNGILGTARVKMTGKPAVLEARREDE